jgi:phosphinothricin acetyltransferase
LRILAAQGYFTAFAGITLPNPGSVKLHETVGFKPIGSFRDIGYKLGRWHDVGWWQLALRPRIDPTGAAVTVDECRRFPEWNQMLAAGLEYINNGG